MSSTILKSMPYARIVTCILALGCALGCGSGFYRENPEKIPPSLLEDETLPKEERERLQKEAAAREAAERAEEESKPAPQPQEVKVPDDVAAPPANAQKTAKGVYYVVLTKGKGQIKPGPQQKVKVHYSGWTTDGKLFDSSVRRGEPAVFPVGALIPGWVDILQHMVEGDKFRVWIPEELAYKGRDGAPQGMLVFEMELIQIVRE